MEPWLELFEYIVEGVALLVVAGCGVIGNIAFILIFIINYKVINTFHW